MSHIWGPLSTIYGSVKLGAGLRKVRETKAVFQRDQLLPPT
jgi:hypothetical protein